MALTPGQLEGLLENVQEAVWVLNRDGSFAYVNKPAAVLFGLQESQFNNYRIFDFFGPENIHFVQQIYKRVLEGYEQQFEIPLVDGSGNRKLLRVRIIPHYANRVIVGSLHYALDITRQKETESALILTRERYQHLINDKNEIHIRLTSEGKIAFINHEMVKELNLQRKDLINRDYHELIPRENHADIEQHLDSLTPDDPSTSFQIHIQFPFGTGDYIWTVQAIYSHQNGEAQLIEYQVTGRNVTNRLNNVSSDEARLKSISVQTIRSLAKTIEVKDPYTFGHQMRVAHLSAVMARLMGLDSDQIETVYYGSIVHDIGKIFIPSDILNRPGKLSDVEFTLIKTHPQIGFDILKEIELPWNIAGMILEHHEHLDGSGYPRGLKADNIMLESRILTVADVVESIASHRPYRPEKGIERSLTEIEEFRGSHYDPDVVDVCLKLFREDSFEFRNLDEDRVLDPALTSLLD